MNKEHSNFSKSAMITNELGLHARAAAKIAKLAMQAEEIIWIMKDSEKVDASSIIDMLTLGCSKGTIITVATDNESDLDVLDNIIILVEKGFGE